MSKTANPRRVQVEGPDGKKVSLDSLPLVSYMLDCHHVGRDYAITLGDILFCDKCGTQTAVARILAQ